MENTNGGIGILGILTLIFISFKLLGVITWSWWWVLAPLWIPTVLALILFLAVIIVAILQ